MRRLFTCLLLTCVMFSGSLYSQRLMDSVTSSFLKMKMPVGTVRQRSADRAAYVFMRGDNRSGNKANPVTPKQVPKSPTNKN